MVTPDGIEYHKFDDVGGDSESYYSCPSCAVSQPHLEVSGNTQDNPLPPPPPPAVRVCHPNGEDYYSNDEPTVGSGGILNYIRFKKKKRQERRLKRNRQIIYHDSDPLTEEWISLQLPLHPPHLIRAVWERLTLHGCLYVGSLRGMRDDQWILLQLPIGIEAKLRRSAFVTDPLTQRRSRPKTCFK